MNPPHDPNIGGKCELIHNTCESHSFIGRAPPVEDSSLDEEHEQLDDDGEDGDTGQETHHLEEGDHRGLVVHFTGHQCDIAHSGRNHAKHRDAFVQAGGFRNEPSDCHMEYQKSEQHDRDRDDQLPESSDGGGGYPTAHQNTSCDLGALSKSPWEEGGKHEHVGHRYCDQ